jgi:uncharacterized OsmC-like protein
MHQLKREMGCSLQDLVRWLPQALGELYSAAKVEVDGQIVLDSECPLIHISGSSHSDRKIALLHIPVMELHFVFAQSLSNDQIAAAIKRFDLYTRRGGG